MTVHIVTGDAGLMKQGGKKKKREVGAAKKSCVTDVLVIDSGRLLWPPKVEHLSVLWTFSKCPSKWYSKWPSAWLHRAHKHMTLFAGLRLVSFSMGFSRVLDQAYVSGLIWHFWRGEVLQLAYLFKKKNCKRMSVSESLAKKHMWPVSIQNYSWLCWSFCHISFFFF